MSLRLDHTHAPACAFPIHYNVLCVFVLQQVNKTTIMLLDKYRKIIMYPVIAHKKGRVKSVF